ncbi:MAG: tetratricopeptide repeat protein, partial [Cyanobacteria bacterium J06621_11]
MVFLQQRYEILEKIGEGTFGITYRGRDRKLPKFPLCAIKKLKVSLTIPEQKELALFLQEAEVMQSRLRKVGRLEGVPMLLAAFEEKGYYYIVQEYIHGSSIREILWKTPIQSESTVISWLKDILSTLQLVHDQGVIHCDIKPDNLIVRESDGKVVLIDFGAVKKLEIGLSTLKSQKSSLSKTVVGTEGYMPWEQERGRAEFNSDLYALGMTAIEALTGRSPRDFVHSWKTEVDLERYKEITPKMKRFLAKCVKYGTTERFQSVRETSRALEGVLDTPSSHKEYESTRTHKPITIGGLHRQISYVQRRWLAIGTAALVLGVGGYLASAYVPLARASFYKEKSTEWVKNGDSDQAIAELNRAIEIYPNDAEAYHKRGALWFLQSDPDRAITDYDKAIEINPDYISAYFSRGNAWSEQGDYDRAIADYDKVIEINPDYISAYFSRGNAWSE